MKPVKGCNGYAAPSAALDRLHPERGNPPREEWQALRDAQASTGRVAPKWLFTHADGRPMMFAGLWDSATVPNSEGEPERLESFTMLTCEPGPDQAEHPDRQPVILEREDWERMRGSPAGWVERAMGQG